MNHAVDVTVVESGAGRSILLLDGGGGPPTVGNIAAHLAKSAHVIAPTRAGFMGTPRAARFTNVAAYADMQRTNTESLLLVTEAGHLPHHEQPARVLSLIDVLIASLAH